MKYSFSEAQYREAVAKSLTLASALKFLGLRLTSGNYSTLRSKITEYSIDTSHFSKASWNKGNFSSNPTSKTAIKQKVIRERGYSCQGIDCGISEWRGRPIPLELEHIDGNPSNNDFSNLLLLCPNCHALTPTWRRAKLSAIRNGRLCIQCGNEVRSDAYKKCVKCRAPENAKKYREAKKRQKVNEPKPIRVYKKRTSIPKFCACGHELAKTNTKGVCLKCSHVAQQRIVWPSVEELQERLKTTSFVQLGRELGVSDNAIRKYLRNNS